MKTLGVKDWFRILSVFIGIAVLLFMPARTIHFWQAWLFLSIYVISSSLLVLFLIKKDPELLQRRMKAGPIAEKTKQQKTIMTFASLGFIATLIVAGLDHRFGWSNVPFSLVIFGNLLIAMWFYILFLVFRENTFTSATVEVAENQKVITTGPYAIVRHPMYAAGILLCLGMPLALGSYWAILAYAFAMPFVIWRILDEEKLLEKELSGYREYRAKVRYRLIPHVW